MPSTGQPTEEDRATATNLPTSTATRPCDQAAAANPLDVTIPDNTEMMPGQIFTKIWRLENTGDCAWTSEYAVRFFYGAQMSAPEAISLRGLVEPGQTVEIAVDMIAPQDPGLHQGNWKLRNAMGQLFGIGPNGDAPFWVRIIVMKPNTETPTATATFTITPSFTPTSTPTPTLTATAALQVRGALVLIPTMTINLDTGEVNPAAGKDLAFQLDGLGLHVLVPQETGLLGVFGANEPGLQACQGAAMSKAGLALDSLPTGTYLCYRTDQGLSGWLRYMSLSTTDHTANIEFQTWKAPTP
jgi:hypothetical protein